MGRSLQARLSLTIALAVLLTVALISLLANLLISRRFENYIMRQQSVRTADIVENILHQFNGLTWDTEALHAAGMYALYDGYIVKVYDKEDRLVWDAENHDMTLCHQVMDEISQRMEKRRPSGGQFVTRDYPLLHDGRPVGRTSIGYYGPYFLSENDFQFLSALNEILVSVGLFAMAVAFVIGGLLARRLARPITKTVDITKQIAEGNYAIRFEERTKTRELSELVATVNHLSVALRRQETLRKRLTADVAHELRTPLAAVGAHLEAMLEGVWEPTAARLRSCHEEIRRLGTLVQDLECLAQVDSDNTHLDLAPVNLLEAARSASESFSAALRNKQLTLTVEGPAVAVLADRDRLSQVTTNLLSNAVKYTPEQGRIRLTTADLGTQGALSVEDTGPGIPETSLPLLFERFYRADQSRARETGGAGIGLAIVKSIVEAHQGTVTVESRPGEGSRFTVTLPKPAL
ncbi:MAG: HAMP domain-containing protein [Oscillospiraceae bacterium]|jgi:signal transduction histidine kinase|nr:HAMP domain-containing protein [Oscillospiraceae bacterium]